MVLLAAHELAQGGRVVLDGREHDVRTAQLQAGTAVFEHSGQHL